MVKSARWAVPALVLGAIGISFAAPLAKLASVEGDVGWVASAFWRTALSTPLLWCLVAITRSKRPPARQWHAAWLLIPGVLFAFDLLTWHLSFAWTTAASATLLANLGVILVGLIGWRFLREHLDARYAAGALLALGGVAWLLTSEPTEGEHPLRLRGDLLAMATAVFYASYILSIKAARSRARAIDVMAIATTAAAIVLLPAMLLADGQWAPGSPRGWLWLGLLALIPHCIGQGLIVLSLSALPASFAAVTLLLQPVATAMWGWLFLGERLTVSQIIAGSVVLIGIVLARLGSGR